LTFRMPGDLLRQAIVFALSAIPLLAIPPERALAHILGDGLVPPQIEAEVRIAHDRVTTDAHLPTPLFLEEIAGGLSLADFETLSDEARAARIIDAWAERNPLRIDGLAVLPRIDLVELQKPETIDPTIPPDRAVELGAVRVLLVYETKGAPREVAIVWRVFPEPGDGSVPAFGADVVAIQLEAEERRKLLLFTPDEPEQIWHSSGGPRTPISFDVPTQSTKATVSVPVLASVVGLAGILLLAPWRRTVSFGRRALGASVAVAGIGFASFEPLPVRLPLPWEAKLERPAAEQGIEIFRSLHKNIYRAFDYTRESDIYDTLARSVDGKALEKIYFDIWESLVLRDQGGAVSRIQSVDILDASVLDARPEEAPPDGEAFFVDCRWRVDGLVRHWGHTHRRTNEFRATYG